MVRREDSIARWEWEALTAFARSGKITTARQLVSLLEAERLARRAHFLVRSGLLSLRCAAQAAASSAREAGAVLSATRTPHIEHRLFALFAE